ncbi:hypothetical protein yc1106_00505 [Curvularia clavata]|uniref:Uncharacterized protein n=1 Tax=Curvularia clavata TaxID=95742 RepID=A0A9Q8YZZ4_CURCL|nr:hypothetical protein yc1106_00505 [Curvularia clavata]
MERLPWYWGRFLQIYLEAGLTFYSYMILNRVLRNRQRVVFLALFWIFMAALIILRTSILVFRVVVTVTSNQNQQTPYLVEHLHIGNFVSLAVIEIISAFFLLRIFSKAKRRSAEVAKRGGLFRYLTQSTEIRLASLALIGITRAITHSSQKSIKAMDNMGQLDRFVYTLECMFPIVMYIDILASRIASVTESHPSSFNYAASRKILHQSHIGEDGNTYSLNCIKRKVGVSGHHVSSSQERIVDGPKDDDMGLKSTDIAVNCEINEGNDAFNDGTIDRTVEFESHQSVA